MQPSSAVAAQLVSFGFDVDTSQHEVCYLSIQYLIAYTKGTGVWVGFHQLQIAILASFLQLFVTKQFFFVRSAICILQLKHSSSRETQNSVSQLFNHGLMFYGLAMPIFYFCLPFFLTHFCADESKLAQYVIYTADKLHSVING